MLRNWINRSVIRLHRLASSDRRNIFFYYAKITAEVPTSGDRRATWTFFDWDRRRSFPLLFGTSCILTVRLKYVKYVPLLKYVWSLLTHDQDVPTQIPWSVTRGCRAAVITVGFVFPLTLNLPTSTVTDRQVVLRHEMHSVERWYALLLLATTFCRTNDLDLIGHHYCKLHRGVHHAYFPACFRS